MNRFLIISTMCGATNTARHFAFCLVLGILAPKKNGAIVRKPAAGPFCFTFHAALYCTSACKYNNVPTYDVVSLLKTDLNSNLNILQKKNRKLHQVILMSIF